MVEVGVHGMTRFVVEFESARPPTEISRLPLRERPATRRIRSIPDRSGQHGDYADARAHLDDALTWAQDSNKARTETIQDGKGSSLVYGVA